MRESSRSIDEMEMEGSDQLQFVAAVSLPFYMGDVVVCSQFHFLLMESSSGQVDESKEVGLGHCV